MYKITPSIEVFGTRCDAIWRRHIDLSLLYISEKTTSVMESKVKKYLLNFNIAKIDIQFNILRLIFRSTLNNGNTYL